MTSSPDRPRFVAFVLPSSRFAFLPTSTSIADFSLSLSLSLVPQVKSVLAEFLVNAGIKPLAVSSYNHLGNNDGKNLSSQAQFKSKEISKSSVIDDMVESNQLLYKRKEEMGPGAKKGEHPDHLVVIK